MDRRAGPEAEERYRQNAERSLDTDKEFPNLRPNDHEAIAHPAKTLEAGSALGDQSQQRNYLAETDWQPTTDDANKLLGVMQELTGGETWLLQRHALPRYDAGRPASKMSLLRCVRRQPDVTSETTATFGP